jgi:hypothetical protein
MRLPLYGKTCALAREIAAFAERAHRLRLPSGSAPTCGGQRRSLRDEEFDMPPLLPEEGAVPAMLVDWPGEGGVLVLGRVVLPAVVEVLVEWVVVVAVDVLSA